MWLGLKLKVQRNSEEQARLPCFTSIIIFYLSLILLHFSSSFMWIKSLNCKEEQLAGIPAIAKPSEGIMGEPVTACLGTHNCSVKRTTAQKPGSSAEPQKAIIKSLCKGQFWWWTKQEGAIYIGHQARNIWDQKANVYIRSLLFAIDQVSRVITVHQWPPHIFVPRRTRMLDRVC